MLNEVINAEIKKAAKEFVVDNYTSFTQQDITIIEIAMKKGAIIALNNFNIWTEKVTPGNKLSLD